MQVTIENPGAEFCKIVREWKATGKLPVFHEPEGQTYSVPCGELFEWLMPVVDAIPDDVAQALGLPDGSCYGQAAELMMIEWNKPVEDTPEELAEQELFELKASEFFEMTNEMEPDLPQMPVIYSKQERIKH